VRQRRANFKEAVLFLKEEPKNFYLLLARKHGPVERI
jgi:hypothetical protein